MGLFLHIEVNTSLSPDAFRDRVIAPLAAALEREQLGSILDGDPDDEPNVDGCYQLALEVTDQERAKDVVEEVLKSVDG